MSTVSIHVGNNLDVLPTLPENSVDAIVTDPPYELGFMGKSWDASGIAYNVELWRQCLRVLKPGGHLLAFSGSRTYHRMTCAIEDAGFEVRDQIMWVYGSGFPKSLNVGKAIDKAAGAEREVVGVLRGAGSSNTASLGKFEKEYDATAPATEAARKWDGWGTALKPAHEPICVARKPLEGTVADNVLKWGTGAINVDGCRVGTEVETWPSSRSYAAGQKQPGHKGETIKTGVAPTGRWPANLIHDGSEEVLELFPETKTGAIKPYIRKGNCGYDGGWGNEIDFEQKASSGSAARFFYCPKASKKDRNDGCEHLESKPFETNQPYGEGADARADGNAKGSKNNHPTVKPTELMRYLCRLVTPPGGTVLDPFMGSGSTGRGAILEGFSFIGCELSEEYAVIARARIDAALKSRQTEPTP